MIENSGNKKDILLKLLSDTKVVLDKHKICFWLDSGTLLGAIRDKGFIPWDNDIDLGCWKSNNDYQLKMKLKIEFESIGYKVFCNDHSINVCLPNFPKYKLDLNFYIIENGFAVTPSSSLSPFLLKYSVIIIHQLIVFLFNKKITKKRFKNTLKILFTPIYFVFIFLPERLKNTFLNLLINLRRNISKHKFEAVPLKYFEEFSELEIFDGKYLIPEESAKYLEYRYGKEWNVPIEDWDTLSQDGTVAQF